MPSSDPAERILAFDVGGTKTVSLIGTPAGGVLARDSWPSRPERGFAAMWAQMARTADRLIEREGPPTAIGVSIGGPLDTEHGVVHAPPNLPGWDGIPLKHLLETRFRVPAYVEHDARAGVLAEWMFGAGRGCQDVVFLTFGTGLGAGMILGGRLHRGHGGTAGEVGHWRMAGRGPAAYGKRGSWEAFSSGSGLPRLVRYLYPSAGWDEGLTAEDVVRAARAGDPRMQRAVALSARHLGQGIAQLIELLAPDVVVLGSLAVRAGDLFLPAVRRIVRRECLPGTRCCPVVPAALGERLGDVAAICAAIYRHGGGPGREPGDGPFEA